MVYTPAVAAPPPRPPCTYGGTLPPTGARIHFKSKVIFINIIKLNSFGHFLSVILHVFLYIIFILEQRKSSKIFFYPKCALKSQKY